VFSALQTRSNCLAALWASSPGATALHLPRAIKSGYWATGVTAGRPQGSGLAWWDRGQSAEGLLVRNGIDGERGLSTLDVVDSGPTPIVRASILPRGLYMAAAETRYRQPFNFAARPIVIAGLAALPDRLWRKPAKRAFVLADELGARGL